MSSLLTRLRHLLGSPSTSSTAATEPSPIPQWIIVGLGNPGQQYESTRHNVGYCALDELAKELHAGPFTAVRGVPVKVSHTTIDGIPVLLARSTTYMNNSGEAIAPLAKKYAVPADHIIVLHDELDLPAGKIRIKKGGNENGHNGLKSLSHELATRDYLRVRMGISRPPHGMSVPDYVLGVPDDKELSAASAKNAAEAARLTVAHGIAQAQNTVHQK